MRTKKYFSAIVALLLGVSFSASAFDLPNLLGGKNSAAGSASQGASQIEVAFSPEAGAEALVVKTINSAKRNIRLASYSFTSPAVVRALVNAKKRGVEIGIVADYKNNISEDRSGKAKAALNILVNNGIVVRTISKYPIHHDKYFVVDGVTTETGSFNYSDAAARRNSENVIVIWNNPAVAKQYLVHWQDRFESASEYKSSY